MSARDFALLSDLLPNVRSLVDQPASDTQQFAYPASQFHEAANAVQDSLHRDLSQLDVDWTRRFASVSVTANAAYVTLPSDLRALRLTCEWDASQNRKKRDIPCAEWSRFGIGEEECFFFPKYVDNSNLPTLVFARPQKRAFTMRVVYDYYPKRLAHGELPEDAGNTAVRLAEHEPDEDSTLDDVVIYAVENPLSSAHGFAPIDSWNGFTKVATFIGGGWAGALRKGTLYTSRPDLPRDWERLFVLEMGVHLELKMPSGRLDEWKREREKFERQAKHQARTVDRRAPTIIRSRPVAGRGLTGDPIANGRGLLGK